VPLKTTRADTSKIGKIRELCLLDFRCSPLYDLSCYGFLFCIGPFYGKETSIRGAGWYVGEPGAGHPPFSHVDLAGPRRPDPRSPGPAAAVGDSGLLS